MALPTSGALSLNQIHVEAGGSSDATASLNDTDIRGLTAASGKTINSTQGTAIDFDDFYGASSVVADVSLTLTTGHSSNTTTIDYVGSNRIRQRGFAAGPLTGQDNGTTSFGSLSTTSFTNYFGGNTLTRITVSGVTFTNNTSLAVISNPYNLELRVGTANVANSDSSFKQAVIGSSTFNRSDATYSTGTGFSNWRWEISGVPPDDSTSTWPPMPAAGSNVTVTFKQA